MENILACTTNTYHNFSLEDALREISEAKFAMLNLHSGARCDPACVSRKVSKVFERKASKKWPMGVAKQARG